MTSNTWSSGKASAVASGGLAESSKADTTAIVSYTKPTATNAGTAQPTHFSNGTNIQTGSNVALTGNTVTYDWNIGWVRAAPNGFARPVIGVNGQWYEIRVK